MKITNDFINRELSWLEFNQRVLDEAGDADNPLLERLNFLGITASNMDEFFMVRVGGLEIAMRKGVTRQDQSGLTVHEQLDGIRERVLKMTADQYAAYAEVIEPALRENGIKRVQQQELLEEQVDYLEKYFEEEIYPVLTPLAIEMGNPMTFKNLSLNIAVRFLDKKADNRQKFAIIPLAHGMDRFISLPGRPGYEYILLEDLVGMYIDRFFPGETIVETAVFRMTCNADLTLQDEMASDFLSEMQELLDLRKHSGCVRLEISGNSSKIMQGLAQKAVRAGDRMVYTIPSMLKLSDFKQLAFLDGFINLKFEKWQACPSPDIDLTKSIFSQISTKPVLLCHPYDSFDPVVRLVEEAADDPNVMAIKQILYRTSSKSPIITALQKAAENGKYVTVIVELKARFDEEQNIEWADKLAGAGVQVIYGIKGLKTHAKLCLVVRREHKGVVRYMHFGTGNYNEKTARIYSDISYLTCDPDLGADATAFFNCITGYSEAVNYLKISQAPIGMKDRILSLIAHEIERKNQGQKALIRAKVNSLVDPDVIKALYSASAAGVQVQLNIRGVCCLKAGVKNLSENIYAVSIVDRFLEHARILHFHHGGDEQVFISSADWMPRNLEKRIELMVPIDDEQCRARLLSILDAYFKDNVKARKLNPDGSYELLRQSGRKVSIRSQELLYRLACERYKIEKSRKPTIFEPHRPQTDKS